MVMPPLPIGYQSSPWLANAPLLALGLASAALAYALHYSLRRGAPWWPTPSRRYLRLLEAASILPEETLLDAGCGDARVLIGAARRFGCRGVGVEVNPLLVLVARARVAAAGLSDRIEIRRSDIFRGPLPRADVIFLFLLQGTNVALEPKLIADLRPGTRIASYSFTLPGLEEIPLPGEAPTLHLYRVPAPAARLSTSC